MHYLSSVYFVNQSLHVSGIFVAHHHEVYCIYTTIDTCCAFQLTVCRPGWYGTSSIPTRPTDSQLKSTTRTNCCIYTGLFEMIFGVLTTCHTQYSWDRSMCIFLFNRTTLQIFVTYLTGALRISWSIGATT